jgi:integrase
VLTALGTALRRGELIGLRWGAVNLLEAKIEVRETFVRGRFTTPKSRASRRVVELGPRTLAVLEEQWQRTSYRGDADLVFGHPTKGTPLETGKLAKRYLRPALARAGIEKPFRRFHDLRHTSLTHAAAAGNPQIYVQARAGHSQGSITERYMHAAPGALPRRRREERDTDVRRAPGRGRGNRRRLAPEVLTRIGQTRSLCPERRCNVSTDADDCVSSAAGALRHGEADLDTRSPEGSDTTCLPADRRE